MGWMPWIAHKSKHRENWGLLPLSVLSHVSCASLHLLLQHDFKTVNQYLLAFSPTVHCKLLAKTCPSNSTWLGSKFDRYQFTTISFIVAAQRFGLFLHHAGYNSSVLIKRTAWFCYSLTLQQKFTGRGKSGRDEKRYQQGHVDTVSDGSSRSMSFDPGLRYLAADIRYTLGHISLLLPWWTQLNCSGAKLRFCSLTLCLLPTLEVVSPSALLFLVDAGSTDVWRQETAQAHELHCNGSRKRHEQLNDTD